MHEQSGSLVDTVVGEDRGVALEARDLEAARLGDFSGQVLWFIVHYVFH